MVERLFFLSALVFFILFAGMIVLRNGEPVVVCFGDSITHGAKVDGHSWVYFLSKEHVGVDFVNEGRNGRKTSDRDEILPVLKRYPHSYAFLLFLGVNDLKNGNDSMVNDCAENMAWMIKMVRRSSRRTRIFILAPPEINVKTMSLLNVRKKYNSNTEKSLRSLEKRYKELAGEESVKFISLLKVVSPDNYVDGLHPNIEGQKEIAGAIWRGIRELFR